MTLYPIVTTDRDVVTLPSEAFTSLAEAEQWVQAQTSERIPRPLRMRSRDTFLAINRETDEGRHTVVDVRVYGPYQDAGDLGQLLLMVYATVSDGRMAACGASVALAVIPYSDDN